MRKGRVNFIFVLIISLGATLMGRLFCLQVIEKDYYRAWAQGQQQSLNIQKGERGEIFFNGGQILAINFKGTSVFVYPEKIINKEETAKKLSQTLNLDENFILEKINGDNSSEIIKDNLSEEEKKAVAELNLPGVKTDKNIFRIYPQGSIASKIIGFLGGEDIGQYGVEGYYDDILQGKESLSGIGKDSNSGDDIFLTIDYNIQFLAEKKLEQAKKELDIEGGTIIVLEPNSGKILALADFPNFDPNKYSKVEDFDDFQNSAIQKFYEPGSVFKAMTMALALDQEKITPQTTYIDEGFVKIGEKTIYNYDKKSWGEKTMTEVLEKSINTGAIFVGKQVGHDLFLSYIDKFGFFEPTGIDLQGEVFSENKELKKGYEVNFATASFGQGIQATPLQMIRAFAVIANGGKLIQPYIVDRITKDGNIIKTEPKILANNIISSKTISQLTAMLVSVVENGYAKPARISHYYVAGKTGTSQIPWSTLKINKKGYSEKTWQSFIGFVPAFNPKFVILVKLDNPKAKTSEGSAVPIFKNIAEYIIEQMEIPPDYE